MRTPVVLVTAALTLAILLAATFLIATGTRDVDAAWPVMDKTAGRIVPVSPTAK